MPASSNRIHQEGGLLYFRCPGCKTPHAVDRGWTYNGDPAKPTFSPSILHRSGHFVPGFQRGDSCWCSFNAEQAELGEATSSFECSQCHSFVSEGRIRFLGDSSHSLAGLTVDLPEWVEET